MAQPEDPAENAALQAPEKRYYAQIAAFKAKNTALNKQVAQCRGRKNKGKNRNKGQNSTVKPKDYRMPTRPGSPTRHHTARSPGLGVPSTVAMTKPATASRNECPSAWNSNSGTVTRPDTSTHPAASARATRTASGAWDISAGGTQDRPAARAEAHIAGGTRDTPAAPADAIQAQAPAQPPVQAPTTTQARSRGETAASGGGEGEESGPDAVPLLTPASPPGYGDEGEDDFAQELTAPPSVDPSGMSGLMDSQEFAGGEAEEWEDLGTPPTDWQDGWSEIGILAEADAEDSDATVIDSEPPAPTQSQIAPRTRADFLRFTQEVDIPADQADDQRTHDLVKEKLVMSGRTIDETVARYIRERNLPRVCHLCHAWFRRRGQDAWKKHREGAPDRVICTRPLVEPPAQTIPLAEAATGRRAPHANGLTAQGRGMLQAMLPEVLCFMKKFVAAVVYFTEHYSSSSLGWPITTTASVEYEGTWHGALPSAGSEGTATAPFQRLHIISALHEVNERRTLGSGRAPAHWAQHPQQREREHGELWSR
ncbi:hypothetical protein J8273_0589 [Carpediemonas membranifera]|uniref:Uncharacterized protein n=1 Tax=Carpediemonas membranifera TaxID=201153 RepID=A0A8J6E562_9EUKA|nr:hypothetical protein J8273_0589 [Carpediemonas membranifera]|eukprot:KAG9395347.1 hypothetical protein J8273_0589 [Carpediemonas membranifera]